MTFPKPYASTQFSTDTATLAIFDPAALAHRAADICDWWSLPQAELLEVNAGNVMFVNIGSDGVYDCQIYRQPPPEKFPNAVVAHVRSVIGSVYVGAGEEVPADGIGPSTMHGGVLVPVPAGTLSVTVVHSAVGQLQVWLASSSNSPSNSFESLLRV